MYIFNFFLAKYYIDIDIGILYLWISLGLLVGTYIKYTTPAAHVLLENVFRKPCDKQLIN